MAKKEQTARALLGVTQEEMAALLKISPGQWSMYESGKRKLPAKAELELNEMLLHAASAKTTTAKRQPVTKGLSEESKKSLQSMLHTNQNRQRLASEKIARLLKKDSMAKAAIEMQDYFKEPKKDQPGYLSGYVSMIGQRANAESQIRDASELTVLEIKLKVLLYEETLLKATLEKG